MKPLLLLAALALALPLAAASPEDPAATVRVDFSNPGLSPSSWTLVLHPDGSGHFTAKPGLAAGKGSIDVSPIDRRIQLSPAYAQRVFAVAASHKVLADKCDSHLKVAFQGWKTITYQDGGVQGGCRFNYSKDKEIQDLSDSLLAVVMTLIEGQRLELLLLHDPLGLDKEMGFLVDSSKDRRVQQICAIRGILQRLEQDQNVMERVRKRARMLLASAEREN